MASKLLLIRHGRSAHAPAASWIDAAGFQRWRDAYDDAGIATGDHPPPALLSAVAAADLVVCSDLRRASESAQRLAPARQITRSPLLREAPIGIPAWVKFRLPLTGWSALIHARWGYQILRRIDATHADRQRAADAVAWLNSLGNDDATIAVVTHGVFRRLMLDRLHEVGWQVPTARRSYSHWSVWTVERRPLA